jgi:hypothetical protein
MNFGGNYYRVLVTYTGFVDADPNGNAKFEYWSGTACTGTRYMKFSQYPPAAMVFSNVNVAEDPLLASTDVRIAYPAYPPVDISYQSYNSVPGNIDTCTALGGTVLGGIWTEITVNTYVAPFSLK